MKCLCCQGEMKEGILPFHIEREGYHMKLDRVPAWVCTQCGESNFDAAEKLEAFMRADPVHGVDIKGLIEEGRA